jgi:hypothetical protein
MGLHLLNPLKLLSGSLLSKSIAVLTILVILGTAFYIYKLRGAITQRDVDIALLESRSAIMTKELTKNIELLQEQSDTFTEYIDTRDKELEMLQVKHKKDIGRAEALIEHLGSIKDTRGDRNISNVLKNTIQWIKG